MAGGLRGMVWVCLLWACIHAAWAKPLTLGITSWIGSAPAYAAEARAYWRAAGLEVKIVKYAEYDELFRDFKAGKLDLAYDMTGTWVDLYQQGVPLVILGETDWSHGGDKLIAKRGFDFAKLRGKPVGVYLDKTSVTFVLAKFLASKGLKLSDVKLVAMEGEPMANAFIKNQFPLILNYDPPAIAAQRDGDGLELATSADYPGSMPEGMAMLASRRAELGQDTLVRFFEGWLKAVRWMKFEAAWPELEQLLAQRTFAGDGDFSGLDLVSMWQSVRFHSGRELVLRNQPAGGMQSYLDEVKQFLRDNGKLQRDFQPEQLVDSSALLEAAKRVKR